MTAVPDRSLYKAAANEAVAARTTKRPERRSVKEAEPPLPPVSQPGWLARTTAAAKAEPRCDRPHTVAVMTDVITHRLSERPDLIDRVYEVDSAWPDFMTADPVMNAFFGQVTGAFPHLCAVATDASGGSRRYGQGSVMRPETPG